MAWFSYKDKKKPLKHLVVKDWDREGVLLARLLRESSLFGPSASERFWFHWPGASIGEGSPQLHPFDLAEPWPKDPYPLDFNDLDDDSYETYTPEEALAPGIALHQLLKRRWPCWWPSYGDNYPVLRLFKEYPKYPSRDLVREGGRATFSYDPWIHEGFRLWVDDSIQILGFFSEAFGLEAFAERPAEGALVPLRQYGHRGLVREGGRATLASYDPWDFEGFRLWVDDISLGVHYAEGDIELFRDMDPVDFTPIRFKRTAVYPVLFTTKDRDRIKADYFASLEVDEVHDPNLIEHPGGRPALERKIIEEIIPSLWALGWNNYPSPGHSHSWAPLWKAAPFHWENYPEDYQFWRTKWLENQHLNKYYEQLRMTLKHAERFEEKKRLHAISLGAWREDNRDEWLAFVRDDPRENLRGATDDIGEYQKAIGPWLKEHSALKNYR